MSELRQPLKRAIVARARSLRRDATEAEHKLWQILRNRKVDGAKFRRQAPIDRFFADFYCDEAMLIVEVDGSQHAERERYDAARTAHLSAKGYRVVRFTNEDVMRTSKESSTSFEKRCDAKNDGGVLHHRRARTPPALTKLAP